MKNNNIKINMAILYENKIEAFKIQIGLFEISKF